MYLPAEGPELTGEQNRRPEIFLELHGRAEGGVRSAVAVPHIGMVISPHGGKIARVAVEVALRTFDEVLPLLPDAVDDEIDVGSSPEGGDLPADSRSYTRVLRAAISS